MINILQTGVGSTELLLFRIVYFVALTCLGSMIYLAFRVRYDYHDGIYVLLGTTSVLCFSFSWGGEHFLWPIPGFVWLLGIILLTFILGLFIGFLLPFDSDVLVRKPINNKR